MAGSGKTVFAMEFLVRGAQERDEPGVFVSFEETAEDLAQNVASMGFDLRALEGRKKILIDNVRVERSEIQERGAFDLDGLFIRLGLAIDSIQGEAGRVGHAGSAFRGLLQHRYSSRGAAAAVRLAEAQRRNHRHHE